MSKDRRFPQRVSAPDYKMKRGTVVRQNGLTVTKLLTAEFDTAGNDSSGVSNKTIAAHGLGVYLPDNAIIIRAWYDVITTFTSATDAGTIAIKAQTANDLVTAIAISDGSNVYDAGMHGTLTAGTTTLSEAAPNTRTQIVHATDIIAGFIKLTAEREIVCTVAVEALTAGKLVLFVEYVISD